MIETGVINYARFLIMAYLISLSRWLTHLIFDNNFKIAYFCNPFKKIYIDESNTGKIKIQG